MGCVGEAEAYNKYESMPMIPFRILERLIEAESAEIIWKLLKDHSAKAYEIERVSDKEKRAMICDGERTESGETDFAKFSVFLDFNMADAAHEEKTFLRLDIEEICPEDRTTGVVDLRFEVLTHGAINHLHNRTTRVNVIIQALIQTLNGQDVDKVGRVFMNKKRRHSNGSKAIGASVYKGKALTMSVNLV